MIQRRSTSVASRFFAAVLFLSILPIPSGAKADNAIDWDERHRRDRAAARGVFNEARDKEKFVRDYQNGRRNHGVAQRIGAELAWRGLHGATDEAKALSELGLQLNIVNASHLAQGTVEGPGVQKILVADPFAVMDGVNEQLKSADEAFVVPLEFN
jgi:hypothetical protein